MAASRIKGLTVEIGGDTSKLQSALKQTETKIKTTSSALRDVNKLLKLDPTNTELLAQKQKLLAEAVSATKEKLALLKEASEQASEQLANGEIGQEQYDALQREIIDTEQQLKKLEKEYSTFGSSAKTSLQEVGESVSEVGEKVSDVGSKISGVGKSLSTKVTAPIVAVGTAAVKAFTEVDDGLDAIAIKTGASGDALDEMGEIMKEIATEIPTDFSTVGAAIGEVNTRFHSTGNELKELSEAFVEYATLNETDVSSSIDNVQQVCAAFGLTAEDVTGVLDTLNKVGQDTGISMSELESSLVSNAGTLKEMGFSASSSATFLGKLETAGIDSTTVLSGLKKALSNSTASGKTLEQGLSDLQNTMKSANTDTDAMNAAIDLFGSKAGTQLAVAINDGTISLEDLMSTETALTDATGSVSDTFEATLDPLDSWKTTMNTLKEALAELGDSIGSVLQPILLQLSEAISSLAKKFNALTPGQQQMIVKIAMIVAVVGPLLVILGTMISTVGAIIGVIGSLIAVIGAISAPILAVIAVIAAFVACGVVLYQNWSTIVQELQQLWNGFTGTMTGIWNRIKAVFVNCWNNLKSTSASVWGAIKNNIVQPVQSAWNTVKGLVAKLKGAFNFSWHLPSIKLPHISISGKFSLNPISVPHFSISWYKKAMGNGMILNSPTIFGMAGGKFLGAGEAGSETVVGTHSLMNMIQNAVNGAGGTTTNTSTINVTVNGAAGQSVNDLADAVARKINDAVLRKNRS